MHSPPSSLVNTGNHLKIRQQAVDYVDNLSEDCTYTDGYQCALQSESDKQSELNRRYKTAFDAHQTVSPVTLKAWSAAHTAFLELTDISAEQKKLKHYRIGFAQADGQTTVWFRPLLLPQIDDGEVVGLMRATIGQDVRITIANDTMAVAKVILGR